MCVGEGSTLILSISLSVPPAAYGTPQAGAQGYTQPAQAYGTSSYANTTAAATPPVTQASYGTQPGYTAQSAYSGYGQQAASAPQRYRQSFLFEHPCFCSCMVGVRVLLRGCCSVCMFRLWWKNVSKPTNVFWLVVTALVLSPPTPREATRPSRRPTGGGSSRPPTLKARPNSLHLQPTLLLHPTPPILSLSMVRLALLRADTTSLDPMVRFSPVHRVAN